MSQVRLRTHCIRSPEKRKPPCRDEARATLIPGRIYMDLDTASFAAIMPTLTCDCVRCAYDAFAFIKSLS